MQLACNPQRDVELDAGWPVDKGHNRRRMEARFFTRFHPEAASSKACLGENWTRSKIPAALSVWYKVLFVIVLVAYFPLCEIYDWNLLHQYNCFCHLFYTVFKTLSLSYSHRTYCHCVLCKGPEFLHSWA